MHLLIREMANRRFYLIFYYYKLFFHYKDTLRQGEKAQTNPGRVMLSWPLVMRIQDRTEASVLRSWHRDLQRVLLTTIVLLQSCYKWILKWSVGPSILKMEAWSVSILRLAGRGLLRMSGDTGWPCDLEDHSGWSKLTKPGKEVQSVVLKIKADTLKL